MSHRISIIVPVYREAKVIDEAIARILALEGDFELIVVDGDPEGSTIGEIGWEAVTCLCSEKGRAAQVNAGAVQAEGDTLLFLHVDTLLPPLALSEIETTVSDGRYVGGCFDLVLDDNSWLLHLYCRVINWRTRRSSLPVGDQALFLKKAVFDEIGGFPEVPILEEVELMRRVKRRKHRIRVSQERVVSSARRFLSDGPLRRIILNNLIGALYYLGVPPARLVRLYVDSD